MLLPRHFLLPLAALTFLFANPHSSGKDAPITLSSRILGRILEKEVRFFSLTKRDGPQSPPELTRKAQEIVAEYEAFLSDNPRDVNALILYGKFLRKVGQEQHAVQYFLEADSINPKLAVVKQQLANYLVEEGRPVDAFPYLIMTIELAPDQPDYHFHLGNFLFLFEDRLVKEKIMSKDSVRSFMHKSFGHSAKLSPKNFDYQLRYAQSFFDTPSSSKEDALRAWDELVRKFPDRSGAEKDYFKLCKARILLELERKSDALGLLQSVSSKSLEPAKQSLIHRLDRKTEAEKKEKAEDDPKKQSRLEVDHRFFIPNDPHLQRLRDLTNRLQEEKMLSELKADAIRARFDERGEIKIDLSQKANSAEGGRGSLR